MSGLTYWEEYMTRSKHAEHIKVSRNQPQSVKTCMDSRYGEDDSPTLPSHPPYPDERQAQHDDT